MKKLLAAALLCSSVAMISVVAHADIVPSLLQKEALDDDHCRDSYNENTDKFCADRDADVTVLKSLGWCYGEDSQPEYKKEWHECSN